MDEKTSLPGHEHLTMADQMRASAVPARLRTSPVTGAVENPRRKYMQQQIQYRASRNMKSQAWNSMKDSEW